MSHGAARLGEGSAGRGPRLTTLTVSLRDACMEADGPIAHVLVAPWGVGPFTTATRRTCSRTSWPSDQLYVMGNLAYMLYGLHASAG